MPEQYSVAGFGSNLGRMRKLCIVLLLALTVRADDAKVAAELKRMTQEMLDAIAPGNADVWKRYTDDRLIYVSEANQEMTKAQLIEELKPLPKGLTGHLEVGTFKAEVHGNVAVTTYVANESLDYYGQMIRNHFRTSDTWVKTKAGWKLIGSQVQAVLEDPPAVALSRETLCGYNGTYRLTAEITTKIACGDDGLTSERTGRPATTFKAEVRDVFFAPGAPRTRRIFLRDANGAVIAFVDRREGLDVRWVRVAD
jgi:hypothetical protein